MTTKEKNFLDSLKAIETDRLLVNIELDRLKIDPVYQRTVNAQRVRAMAERYDERLMGVLTCSVREDGIYVVDGQHRLALARLLNHETVMCELRTGLTIVDESSLFYQLDTARVSLSSDDAFRALLAANDRVALAIVKAVEAAGLTISFTGNIPGGVRAFKMLLRLVSVYGIELVHDTLQVLGHTWPESTHPAPAGVLEGMTYFLKTYPEVNQKELSRALRQHTSVEQLVQAARTISGSLAWNTRTSMSRAILTAYNSRRSTNRLEDRLAS